MSDLHRYHRQMLLPGIGEEGQRRLGAGHAIVVGCGALGCVIADMLARAGVGRLTLIDRDIVEPTNLQRQTLFDEADAAAGLPKAEAARRRLAAVNSQIRVTSHVADFAPGSAERLAGLVDGEASVLLDGSDNFAARLLLNDLAVKQGVPLVYGGAVGTRGMMAVILPGEGPCLRCIMPEAPALGTTETCDTVGVLGPVAAIVGAAQAAEAIKLLCGAREVVSRTMLDFDVWRGTRRRLDLSAMRDAACACCARGEFDWLDGKRGGGSASLCGRSAVQIAPAGTGGIDLEALAGRLRAHGPVVANRFLVRATLRDERRDAGDESGDGGETGVELTVFADGRAIVGGVGDVGRARAVCARYVGG